MGSPVLDLRSTPDELVVSIRKEGGLSGFQWYGAAIMGGIHFAAIGFIYKSIIADGLPLIQGLFVVFGLYMLYSVNKQLRALVLYSLGVDTVEVKEGVLRFTSRLGILSRRVTIKLDAIRKLELVSSVTLGVFSPKAMKEGAIRVEWGRRKELHLGQFLELEDLTTVYEALKRYILVQGRSIKS